MRVGAARTPPKAQRRPQLPTEAAVHGAQHSHCELFHPRIAHRPPRSKEDGRMRAVYYTGINSKKRTLL